MVRYGNQNPRVALFDHLAGFNAGIALALQWDSCSSPNGATHRYGWEKLEHGFVRSQRLCDLRWEIDLSRSRLIESIITWSVGLYDT